jgi:hypothetical protein
VLAGLAFTREEGPTPTVVPNSVVSIDPDTNRITGVVAVGRSPDAVTTSGNAVWVANRSDDTLTHVDARSGQTRTLGGFPFPTSLDREGARIWVGNNTGGNLVAIDSESGGEVDRVRLPAAAASFVAHGAGSLWVSEEEGAVFRVSLSTRKVLGRWPESPHGIAYGHGAAWVANAGRESCCGSTRATARFNGSAAAVCPRMWRSGSAPCGSRARATTKSGGSTR